ncbi:MAG: hypothetical protein H6641_24035 [Caldilineaceae bacterium]|nr:hypothetical protein [Caldilineaceae bacterium]
MDASSGSINVPIVFAHDGADISSLAFSIDYDESCLSLDATDANNDGIPDAVSGFPGGYAPTVLLDPADTNGELDIRISDQDSSQTALNDGAVVTIEFDVISTCPTTNISFSADPAASFGNTDGDPVTGTATGGTLTLTYNSAPTDILLDNTSVDENLPAGTLIGTFSTADPDSGDTFIYTIVDDPDNAFAIVDNTLVTGESFDAELMPIFLVTIRSADSGGLFFEKPFEIQVNSVNEPPVLEIFSYPPVPENEDPGYSLGDFYVNDPDEGDTPTFTLSGGDAAAFTVEGISLQTTVALNYEIQSTYIFTARVTDSGGLFDEQLVTVDVFDVNDPPVAVDDPIDPLVQVIVGPTTLDVLANDSDEDAGSLLTIESVSSANAAIVDLDAFDDGLLYTPPAGNGAESFTYVAADHEFSSNPATVDITYVADDLRGDCNGNGGVDAGDFSAIALEYFDFDSSPNWFEIYQQGYLGSPIGCDANASQNGADPINAPTASVDVADIICTVFVFFGNDACTSGSVLAANAASPARLSVASVNAAAGDTVQLPISLTTNGNAIAAAGFTIEYDAASRTFDTTDADGDGIPDALALDLPEGVQAWVQAEAGAIQIAVAAVNLSLPTLGDGDLATVTFGVTGSRGLVSLSNASLGDVTGRSVVVEIISNEVNNQTRNVFLPLLVK